METVSVRYIVDDVPAAVDFYVTQLQTNELATLVDRLRVRGARFRSDIVTGRGGNQIPLEDPAGNLIELFEPAEG